MRRRWSEYEIEYVKANYELVPTETIAGHLGRSSSAVKQMARLAGLCRRALPKLTTAEIDYLRESYGKVPVVEIAKVLGRLPHSVSYYAGRLALTSSLDGHIQDMEAFLMKVRQLRESGFTDAQIAREVGCSADTVGKYRSKLGFPGMRHHPAFCAKGTQTALERYGRIGRPFAEVNKVRFVRFAEKHGWPPDTTPQVVLVLNLLTSVGLPLSRREMNTVFPVSERTLRKAMSLGWIVRRYSESRTNGMVVPSYSLSTLALTFLEDKLKCEKSEG